MADDQIEQELLKRSFAISDRIPASLATAADLFLFSTGVGAWAVRTINDVKVLLGMSSALKFTTEGGLAVRLTNKTGGVSVKGNVVSPGSVADESFVLQSAEFDAMGIVYESGIADGELCWVVVSGIAEVLLKDTTAATRGYWVKASDVDGRAEVTTPPASISALATSEHFREIGHCVQSKDAGTDVLAKIVLHFN